MQRISPFTAKQPHGYVIKYGAMAGLASLLILAGCASEAEMIGTNSSNQEEYRITCGDNPFSHRQDCHDRAAEVCSGLGYTILREDEMGRGQMVSAWSLTTHELVIKCG